MHRPSALAASLLAFIPPSLAVGTARVVNNCGTEVYFASVAQGVHSQMKPLPVSGYSEMYNKANVGISIKLSPSANGAVTQFEFTWAKPNINYDISNIDGNPFAKQGMSLVPSKAGAAGFPSCVTVDCPAGQDRCDGAYNLPDDVRTKVCPEDSDLTFTLCPGGAPSGGKDNSAPPVANSPAASPGSAKQPAASPSPAKQPVGSSSSPGKAGPSKSATPTAKGSWNRPHARRGHIHSFD